MADEHESIGAKVERRALLEARRPKPPVGQYTATVGEQTIDLPIIQVEPDLGIALLMTTDVDLDFVEACGAELAERLRPHDIAAVVSAATLGIPVGAAVAKHLGMRRQFVLLKTNKAHLVDALTEPLRPLTAEATQMLRLDRRWLPDLAGKRVAFVDDVITSGSSASAALALLRKAGAKVVVIGAFLTEGDGWQKALGPEDAELVQVLGQIPVFRPKAKEDGSTDWVEDWSTPALA